MAVVHQAGPPSVKETCKTEREIIRASCRVNWLGLCHDAHGQELTVFHRLILHRDSSPLFHLSFYLSVVVHDKVQCVLPGSIFIGTTASDLERKRSSTGSAAVNYFSNDLLAQMEREPAEIFHCTHRFFLR